MAAAAGAEGSEGRHVSLYAHCTPPARSARRAGARRPRDGAKRAVGGGCGGGRWAYTHK